MPDVDCGYRHNDALCMLQGNAVVVAVIADQPFSRLSSMRIKPAHVVSMK